MTRVKSDMCPMGPIGDGAGIEDIAFVVSSGRKQCGGDARDALAQEVTDNPDRVKGALTARTEDRHQDLLRLRRHRGAIAAAYLAIDDRGAERLFGPPVARIDGRVVQEAEKRRPFAVEMSHQAPDRRNP